MSCFPHVHSSHQGSLRTADHSPASPQSATLQTRRGWHSLADGSPQMAWPTDATLGFARAHLVGMCLSGVQCWSPPARPPPPGPADAHGPSSVDVLTNHRLAHLHRV